MNLAIKTDLVMPEIGTEGWACQVSQSIRIPVLCEEQRWRNFAKPRQLFIKRLHNWFMLIRAQDPSLFLAEESNCFTNLLALNEAAPFGPHESDWRLTFKRFVGETLREKVQQQKHS
jgi:hypothetical protein